MLTLIRGDSMDGLNVLDEDYKNFVERMGSFDMELDSSVDDVLAHFGVKGMKWGVRRARKTPITTRKKRDLRSKSEKRKDDLKKLSDVELRQKLNRMQMERQYAQLSSQSLNAGAITANVIMSKIGNKVIDRVIDRTIMDPIDAYFKGRK